MTMNLGKGSFRSNESYGVVFSLKPNFGFIQPIYSDEQIYFAAKEYFDGIKVGDRVGYIVRSSSKGDYAEGLRHLIQVIDNEFNVYPNPHGHFDL